MRIEKKDLKQGKVVVVVENLDDLWHLSQIIEEGDRVRGKTERKIKIGGKEESVKKTMTLSLQVKEVDFKDRTLRISGLTVDESEEVPKGSHHTITLEEGSKVGVVKNSWAQYQLKRLTTATAKQARVLLLVMDREEAIFALLKSKGYEILSQFKGKVAKKGVDSVTGNFYGDLIKQADEYVTRHRIDTVILASPAFWKDDLMKELKDDSLRKKIVLATCSSVGNNAIEEVLKRPELKEVLKQQRAAEESNAVEELMKGIAKDGLVAYGKKEVEESVNNGNVKVLLITDVYIHKNRAESEVLMKNAETVKGDVVIINSENEAGKKLDSLGGIAVLTRYKV